MRFAEITREKPPGASNYAAAHLAFAVGAAANAIHIVGLSARSL